MPDQTTARQARELLEGRESRADRAEREEAELKAARATMRRRLAEGDSGVSSDASAATKVQAAEILRGRSRG